MMMMMIIIITNIVSFFSLQDSKLPQQRRPTFSQILKMLNDISQHDAGILLTTKVRRYYQVIVSFVVVVGR